MFVGLVNAGFVDGRIVEQWTLMDTFGLMQQLGNFSALGYSGE